MQEEKEIINLDIGGNKTDIFNRLFSKLTLVIEESISSLSSKKSISKDAKETVDDVLTIAQNYLEAKIQKPSIENQKILAEIRVQFATADEKSANAQKLRLEAESIAIDNEMKKLEAATRMITLLKKLKIYNDENENLLIDFSEDKE
jgi:hypothetical protein